VMDIGSNEVNQLDLVKRLLYNYECR